MNTQPHKANPKPTTPTPTRRPRTPQEVAAEQRRLAEKSHEAATAKLPAKTATATAVAVPDNRTSVQRYLDEVAPASIVGRMIKFNGKDGVFKTADDDEPIGDDVDFTTLCDQTL